MAMISTQIDLWNQFKNLAKNLATERPFLQSSILHWKNFHFSSNFCICSSFAFSHLSAFVLPQIDSQWLKCKQSMLQNNQRRHWMMLRSLCTVATNVATRAKGKATWKRTCWFTVMRSLLLANNAISPIQLVCRLRRTCWNILEKGLSFALNVTPPLQKLVNWKDTL